MTGMYSVPGSATQKVNELYRACNKAHYDIDGAINDLYCGKPGADRAQIDAKLEYLNQKVAELESMYAASDIQGGFLKE